MVNPFDPARGIDNEDLAAWLAYNVTAAGQPGLAGTIAPFPPAELMHRTTGLTTQGDFARHGESITGALAECLPHAPRDYRMVVDFGVGVGRVARVFKGHRGTYLGLDIDTDNLAWVSGALDHVAAVKLVPNRRIPLGDGIADLIHSVSVFSHMDADSCAHYLGELLRVLARDGTMLLTTHGVRALERAQTEPRISEMLCLQPEQVAEAREQLARDDFCFMEQFTHLTSSTYRYGMTFLGAGFVRRLCETTGKDVDVTAFSGQIADFQDVIRIQRLP